MLTRKLIAAGCLAAITSGLALAEDAPKAPEPAKAAEPPKPDYTLTANVYLVSNYLFRGITQTWGKPAVQGGFDFAHDSGIYLGTWASNVSGNQFPGGSMEWDFYGGYNYKINDDMTVGAGVIEYYYPGANYNKAATPGADQVFNTFEGNVSFSWKWIGAKVSYAFTDYFGANQKTGFDGDTKGTYYPELNVNYPLMDNLTLVAHVGYTHYAAKLVPPGFNGETNPSYWDYKLGVSYVWKDGWTAGAYWVDASNSTYYKNTVSFANSSTIDLAKSTGYITVGRTF